MKTLKNILMGTTLALLCACNTQAQKSEEATEETTCGNPVVENIMARRSIRKYTDQPVEREKLELIVECGINAPNGSNRQPWEVRVVTSQDYINGITELFKKSNPKMAEGPDFKNMFRNGTAVIFIASPNDGGGHVDAGLMAENMMLSALSVGLGTCCLGGPIAFMKNSPEAKPYVDQLEIPEGYSLHIAIAVGYPDEAPEAKPRDASKVKWIE